MAQLPIVYGAAPNDGTGTPWRTAFQRTQDNFTDLYALQSQIVSAGDVRFAGEATTEAKIDAACTQAEVELKTIVAIPAIMLPYDTTLVGAHPTIRRVREGGDYNRYDVRAYGADPLGALDATAAFNAIPITEETYVSQGTYLIGGTLTKTRMVGDGPTSVLFLKASASLTSFQSPGTEAVLPIITNPNHTGSDDTGIRFSRFSVDGNSANQSHNQGMAGIYLRNVTDALIQDVEVDDIVPDSQGTFSKQSFCFLALESEQVHIRGGRYTNAGYECVGFRNAVLNSSIVGAYAGAAGLHSIQCATGTDFGATPVVSPSNITITSNVIEQGDGRAAAGGGGDGLIVHTVTNATVTGNTIRSTRPDGLSALGIVVHSSSSIVVSGNMVHVAGPGIDIKGPAQFVQVTGNFIQSFLTGFAGVGAGIELLTSTGEPSDISIVGNTVYAAANRTGILLRGQRLHVANNSIPQTLRGIYVEGTTTVTSDVSLYDNDIKTTFWGIQVTQNASRVRIRGNTIRQTDAGDSGINLIDTCDDIELTNNDLRGIATAANQLVITTTGTNIVRRGNRFTNGAVSGRLVLVNGTVTWSTTEILTGDSVILSRVVGTGTTRGVLTLGTITDRTSVVVRSEDLSGSLSADDDSTVFAEIVH